MWNDRGLAVRGAFQSAPPISGSKIMKVRIKKLMLPTGPCWKPNLARNQRRVCLTGKINAGLQLSDQCDRSVSSAPQLDHHIHA